MMPNFYKEIKNSIEQHKKQIKKDLNNSTEYRQDMNKCQSKNNLNSN